jgi:threonine aldolase
VALEVENTHNMAGGTVLDRPLLDSLLEVARRRGLPIHHDGARLFNAAAALGVAPASLAAGFDSVMISLSKGLGAPVGSLLCGSRHLVYEARRVRKMLGGGMRQVGVLAAAALVGLRRGTEPLAEDHANARRLATGLAEIPGLETDPGAVETNIVMCRVGDAAGFLARAAEAGVLAVAVSPDTVRFVTHRDVARADVDRALAALRTAA